MAEDLTHDPKTWPWRRHTRVFAKLWLLFTILAALIAVPYVLVTGILMALGYLPDWTVGGIVKPAVIVMLCPIIFLTILYPPILFGYHSEKNNNEV